MEGSKPQLETRDYCEELSYIQRLKVIMTLLVVLYHSGMFFTGTWVTFAKPVFDGHRIVLFLKWLNSIHIQAFTFASGYLFYFNRYYKNKYRSFLPDIKKRAFRLMVPFYAVLVLWIIPLHILTDGFVISDIVKNYILGVRPEQLWYIPMIFLLFLLFWMCSDYIPVKWTALIAVLPVSIIGGGILDKLHVGYFQLPATIKYIPYFFLGGLVWKNGDPLRNKKIKHYILSGTVVLGVVWIALNSGFFEPFSSRVLRIVQPVFSIAQILVIFHYIKKIEQNESLKRLETNISDHSFGIYLIHQQIIYGCIMVMNGIVPPVLQVLLSFVISFGISYIVVDLLRKNRFAKVLIGG